MAEARHLYTEQVAQVLLLQVMMDPVIASDGYTYDRLAILTWIKQHPTSPMTREWLVVDDIQPNEELQTLCAERHAKEGARSEATPVTQSKSE